MSYKIGIGMYDCTGPAAEQTMFGYSYPEQRTAGIADRQWARAFVIQDEKNNFLCLTVVDVCIIFQSLKDEVLKRLTKRIGKIFNSKNTMISAIHNHSGPAGYSDYPMFISSDKGFCKLTFNAIVNGCVHAITRAFHNMKPAKILFTTSELVDCGGQRSKEAWESNPQKEKERYGETDKSIVLLKFIDSTDKLFGILVFYALHAVSLGVKNNLISADNRGYAARLLERKFGNDPYSHDPHFIAAFANSNGGDVSPNVGQGRPPGGEEDFKRMKVIGDKFYQKTIEMINSDAIEISGNTRCVIKNIDLANTQIDGTNRKTCDAAFGPSFMGASSEDSPSPVPFFIEGLTKTEFQTHKVAWKYSFRNKLLTLALRVIYRDMADKEWAECQGEKSIILPISKIKYRGIPFYPHVFPLQIFKLGTVSIIGFTGEMTSIAGIRLKNTIQDSFKGTDIKYTMLNCYANSYSEYTTTKEEYNQQHYEGASTLFGPNQLEALQQEFKKLAQKMINNESIIENIQFKKTPIRKLRRFHTRIHFDDDPMGKNYGDVLAQPNKSYNIGEKVLVEFVGGSPRNNLRTMDSFLEVQRKTDKHWKTIYRDLDFETKFHWKRKGIAHSVITIEWDIPENEIPGEYRIIHKGDSKSRWRKKITPYKGISNAFMVNENSN